MPSLQYDRYPVYESKSSVVAVWLLLDIRPYYILGCFLLRHTTLNFSLFRAQKGNSYYFEGGYSPDKLRVDEDAVRFVKEFVESGKPVFVICHGPQLFITARVLKGRKITG